MEEGTYHMSLILFCSLLCYLLLVFQLAKEPLVSALRPGKPICVLLL